LTGIAAICERSAPIGSHARRPSNINDAISIHEQDVGGEHRFVYYGETDAQRLLAVVVTERGDKIRVVTAYNLDAGQKRDYFTRRLQGE